jgi:hypothetical protein
VRRLRDRKADTPGSGERLAKIVESGFQMGHGGWPLRT